VGESGGKGSSEKGRHYLWVRREVKEIGVPHKGGDVLFDILSFLKHPGRVEKNAKKKKKNFEEAKTVPKGIKGEKRKTNNNGGVKI